MKFFKKWYTYQKERFPVLMFGTYIFAIAFAVFCVSNSITKNTMNFEIQYYRLIPMFIVAFLQFLMVRIIDEFKDYEEDCKYRPYRPVPRGLISLKELKVLFIICAILQLGITIYVNVKALIFLAILWIFFAIMTKSFFIKKFLDKHLLCEVALDELMMPILAMYLSCFTQGPIYEFANIENYYIFLFMTYIVSWTVEIARKIRCKEDEEEGVKTYTAVFGIKVAMLILFILETILMLLQIKLVGTSYLMYMIGVYIISNLINLWFVIKKSKKASKFVGLTANLYIIICYISLVLLIV